MTGRLLTLFCLLTVIIAPLAPRPVEAARRADRRLAAVLERADAMIAQLELEGARALLEEAARNRAYRTARGQLKGRLFATLGRARAELGDMEGAEEAFQIALRWDLKASLPKSASPKIRAVLERVRASAGQQPRAAAPPATARKPKSTPKPRTATKPKRRRARKSASTPPLPSDAVAVPESSATTSIPGSTGPGTRPDAPPSPPPSPTPTPAAEPAPAAEPPPIPESIPPTAEVASPSATSSTEPPSLSEAWSAPTVAPRPAPSPGMARTSTTVPSPTTTWGPGLNDAEIIGLSVAGAALAVGLVTLAVVLAQDGGCSAPEGFGCTQVEVLPLVRF